MKSLAKVQKSEIQYAIDMFNLKSKKAIEIRDAAIIAYYEKFFVNGNRFTKWFHRNKTPIQFVLSKIPSYSGWSSVLYSVLSTKEEYNILSWYDRNSDKWRIEYLQHLCTGSLDEIFLSGDMCKVVRAYGD